MHYRRMFIVIALLALLSACTFVTPENAALLDTTAANARAYDKAVSADPATPANVKAWIHSDAGQWTNFANWANGRPATTQPATQP